MQATPGTRAAMAFPIASAKAGGSCLASAWQKQKRFSMRTPLLPVNAPTGTSPPGRFVGGWKLFGERMAKAKAILDENSALASKCPDWYITMQKVAQGQSWELPQATALLEQAIKFEPEYSYYYRIYANYLLPKGSAEDGDAPRCDAVATKRLNS